MTNDVPCLMNMKIARQYPHIRYLPYAGLGLFVSGSSDTRELVPQWPLATNEQRHRGASGRHTALVGAADDAVVGCRRIGREAHGHRAGAGDISHPTRRVPRGAHRTPPVPLEPAGVSRCRSGESELGAAARRRRALSGREEGGRRHDERTQTRRPAGRRPSPRRQQRAPGQRPIAGHRLASRGALLLARHGLSAARWRNARAAGDAGCAARAADRARGAQRHHAAPPLVARRAAAAADAEPWRQPAARHVHLAAARHARRAAAHHHGRGAAAHAHVRATSRAPRPPPRPISRRTRPRAARGHTLSLTSSPAAAASLAQANRARLRPRGVPAVRRRVGRHQAAALPPRVQPLRAAGRRGVPRDARDAQTARRREHP